MDTSTVKAVYRPRRPRESPLWRLFDRHFDRFRQLYDERFAERYGPLRPVVPRVVEDFLKCGILDWGFARIWCPDCRKDWLLAFSCKRRSLCPSCDRKRQIEFGEFVATEVLEAVPHRHVVLSIPRRLRPFFLRNRHRLAKLARAAYETVKELLQAAGGKEKGVPGAVVCLQTFGDLLDFHPHAHLIVSWGLFGRDGTFHAARAVPEPETIEKLFRHKVFRLLLEEEAIDDGLVKNLLSWRHTGFGAYVGQEIAATDARARERVASYMAHPAVLVGRILMEQNGQKVIYKAAKIHPRHGANFRVFDPPARRSPEGEGGLEFLAQVVAHIPNTHEKTTIYYGRYSNKARGIRKALGSGRSADEHNPANRPSEKAEEDLSAAARANWARLTCLRRSGFGRQVRKVYEADPLVCPNCGSQMRVIALIDPPAGG